MKKDTTDAVAAGSNNDDHSTTNKVPPQPRKRDFTDRFSFRRLFRSSPFFPHRLRYRNQKHRSSGADSLDVEKATPSDKDSSSHSDKNVSRLPSTTESKAGKSDELRLLECPLCLSDLPSQCFPKLSSCTHRSCYDCFQQYLAIEIYESRVNVTCPECPEPLHPNDVKMILSNPVLFEKYQDFMLRRVLAVETDARWCPAPDCGYAVIASGCASCPKLHCERPGCGCYFCYHCKATWHPNQTCDAARAQRSANRSSIDLSQDAKTKEDIKRCPICRVLIVKMDDGSCNHMTCAVCGAEFCWLCMNVVGDLHYLSPSGCTFWGKKPWSRKKKILWQLGILVGAPVGIALIAGIAIPAILIGFPIWTGRKLYTKFQYSNNIRRNTCVSLGVLMSIMISPLLATISVAIGVPILLFYVYGVVPVSLCRSSGCGVSASSSGVRLDFDESPDQSFYKGGIQEFEENDLGREGNVSISEMSLSFGSGILDTLGKEQEDRESSSTVALAGSILAQKIDMATEALILNSSSIVGETSSVRSDTATSSTKALNGSIFSCKTDGTSTKSYKINEGMITAENMTNDSMSQRSGDGNLSLTSLEELTATLVQRVRSFTGTDDEVQGVQKPNDSSKSKASISRGIFRNMIFGPFSQTSSSSKEKPTTNMSPPTLKEEEIVRVIIDNKK